MNSAANADATADATDPTANPAVPACKDQRADVPWPSTASTADDSKSKSKPGRRASWKRRQAAKINDDYDHTGFDADVDSAAYNDEMFHDDFDVSDMQRLAISQASSYSTSSIRAAPGSTSSSSHLLRTPMFHPHRHLLGVFFLSMTLVPVWEVALHPLTMAG